jgi:cell division protein FtsW
MGCTMGLIFLAGVRMGQFASMILLSLGAVVAMAMSSEYRMRRLLAFQDPWADQFSSGYQLVQSLIAFGRGEWFGVGLGHSVQKLFYLPEAHTDFVFAILAEELGLVGVVATISLFAILVAGLIRLSHRAMGANQPFMAYIAAGAGLIIAGQVFINIGVTSGLLPTKGLTLPFVSFGGSSLIACCCLIALAYRIQYELLNGSSMTPQSVIKVRKANHGGNNYARA